MRTLVLISTLMALFLASIDAKEVVVGAKTFTESKIFGEMTCLLLEKEGHTCKRVFNVSTKPLSGMFLKKSILIYWEYDGTIMAFLGVNDKTKINEKLKSLGVVRGVPAQFSNPFVLVSKTPEWKKITDISGVVVSMVMPGAFKDRSDAYEGLSELYNLNVTRIEIMSQLQGYKAVLSGDVDVAVMFGTDPQIIEENFTVMKDDLGYFPSYVPAPIYHEENKELFKVLDLVGPLMTFDEIVKLNKLVNYDKYSHKQVAELWLKEKSLL